MAEVVTRRSLGNRIRERLAMRAGHESATRFAIEHPLRYVLGLLSSAAIIACTGIAAAAVIFSILLTRSGRRWTPRLESSWAKFVVRASGMRLEVTGLEHIKPEQSYVIVSNHQSHLDICATIVALGRRILFVAKQELLKVPVFGRAVALSDHIVINRHDSQRAINTVNHAIGLSQNGSCILFYAEGTRSEDGRIRKFKKGAVTLALRSRLPILPLSVRGTREILPKGSLLIRPRGRVRIAFGRPIETGTLPFAARDELNEQVWATVVRNYVELE